MKSLSLLFVKYYFFLNVSKNYKYNYENSDGI